MYINTKGTLNKHCVEVLAKCKCCKYKHMHMHICYDCITYEQKLVAFPSFIICPITCVMHSTCPTI